MTLRVAVIGVGSMGMNHARVFWDMSMVDLVAIADPNESQANLIARKFATRAYPDYRQMLDEMRPDAVIIAVPTILHHRIALDVIERGISLLIEKPISFTIEEGQNIINTARRAGVKLMIGHIERFNPAIIALKERISANEIGHIFQMDAHRQGPFPTRVGDVGVAIDLAVHDLDVMLYVSQKDVIRLYAETEKRIHSKYEDMLTCMLRMSDGSVGTLAINWLSPIKIREFFITGERGLFRVDYLTQDLFFYENPVYRTNEWDSINILRGVREGQMVRYVIAKKEPLRAELDAFVDCVLNHTASPVSGEDGLKALGLAKAIIHSGTEHEIVDMQSVAYVSA
jgi:UDP-N-acetylglucosamine 3-dehydrogenase